MDGTAVLTRPVQLDDEPRFYRLWPRLSRDTIYRRFHSPLHWLPPETVHRLVDVDHQDSEAVVAVAGDEVVGVARYARDCTDPTRADFAVLVEDAWQGRGLGHQLLEEIFRLAADRGVRTATAAIQADNARMVALVRHLLPGSRLALDSAVYQLTGSIS
jgi:GNAT superfamily N-acetyltransferase